ncbi:MAG: hypothetical protein AAF799_39150 [Myxococcota bacterium]
MTKPFDPERTQELPPEPLDDLAPLQSTGSEPVPRPPRTQTISLPPPLEERSSANVEHDRQLERELASRRMSIARREQRHRHNIERADQRHRHEQRLQRRRQEARIIGSVLLLVVTSGLAWIVMPGADAAQMVFTTSFGAAAGYLGARNRGREDKNKE